MVDIFKKIPTLIINLYKSAIIINDDLSIKNTKYDQNQQNQQNQLIRLKKYTKKKVLKMINILKKIFEDPDILIRLPYNLLITVQKYNIFDIFAKYNGIWLDKQVSNYLNNKYKIEIILLLKLSKKIDNYIILYILQFLMLKGGDMYSLDMNINQNANNIEYVSVGSNLFIIV
jgi:hypothetical protein